MIKRIIIKWYIKYLQNGHKNDDKIDNENDHKNVYKNDHNIIKDVVKWQDLVSKKCISSNWHVYIIQNMSRSRSRILDPVFKGGGAASPKGKWIG